MNVRQNIERSAAAFRDVVWPVLGPAIGGGELIPVESVSDSEFARRLDMQAGIDAWIFYDGSHMRGLASRVQWMKTGDPFDTFTTRLVTDAGSPHTEYEKRKIAIATPGAVYAYLSAQAYLQDGTDHLLTVAAARTADVNASVDRGIGYERPNGHGGRMWITPWHEMSTHGLKVVRIDRRPSIDAPTLFDEVAG